MKDQVTLKSAKDYGRRCTSIGLERYNAADLQDAMSHPNFKDCHHELLDKLAAEYRQNRFLLERPPFTTIEIGAYPEVHNVCQVTLDGDHRYRISDFGNELLDLISPVGEPGRRNLYRATNEELGHPLGCTVVQSFAALKKIGARKLPSEAGPQYWHQFTEQKVGDWQLVYMDPIKNSDLNPCVFYIGRDEGGLWLSGRRANPNYFYPGNCVWIYTR